MSMSHQPSADLALDEPARVAARLAIMTADARLQELSQFVGVPDEELPAVITRSLSGGPVGGESTAQFLERWWTLFQPEIALLHEIRNRVAHRRDVPAATLAAAHVLSRRLIEVTFPGSHVIEEIPFG